MEATPKMPEEMIVEVTSHHGDYDYRWRGL